MSDTLPCIGVLETGRPPEELALDHGDYPSMVASWLGVTHANYRNYAVLDMDFPANPKDADLWVITGSRFGAYDDLVWIRRLEEFVRACRDCNVPMMGICFGHQVIAQALGGVVRKSDKGWGLGIHDYAPQNWPDALGPQPEVISLQAYHQDQVETLPKGAEVIAKSDFCANAALWYPGFALTVQGHPEIGKPYIKALLNARRGTVLQSDAVDAALADMGRDDTRADLAALVRHVFLPVE